MEAPHAFDTSKQRFRTPHPLSCWSWSAIYYLGGCLWKPYHQVTKAEPPPHLEIKGTFAYCINSSTPSGRVRWYTGKVMDLWESLPSIFHWPLSKEDILTFQHQDPKGDPATGRVWHQEPFIMGVVKSVTFASLLWFLHSFNVYSPQNAHRPFITKL